MCANVREWYAVLYGAGPNCYVQFISERCFLKPDFEKLNYNVFLYMSYLLFYVIIKFIVVIYVIVIMYLILRVSVCSWCVCMYGENILMLHFSSSLPKMSCQNETPSFVVTLTIRQIGYLPYANGTTNYMHRISVQKGVDTGVTYTWP